MKRATPRTKPARRSGSSSRLSPAFDILYEKLKSLSDVLAKSLDLDRILDALLAGSMQAAEANRGAAYLLEADGRLSLRAYLGFPAAATSALADFFGGHGWLLGVLDTGEPLAVSADGKAEGATADVLTRARVRSFLVVPLTLGKDRLGTLVLGSTHSDLTPNAPFFNEAVRLQLGQATALARLICLSTASEQRFRELVQGLDAIVWEADPATLQSTFISRRAEEILGYPLERWLTEPNFWANIIHEEDRKRALAYCRKAVAEGRSCDFEYRALAADGRFVWLHDTVRVVQDEQGRVQQLRGLMVDITDRKQAEKQLEERSTYLHSLIENSPVAIVVLDAQHRVQMVNPAFEQLFLYRQSEIVGTNLDAFIASTDKATEASIFTRRILAGEAVHAATRRRRKDGTLVDVEVHGVPLFVGGKLNGIIAIYRNITERLRAERLQEALYRIADAAAASPTLDDLYRAVHRTIESVMPADNFYIALYDEKAGELSFPYFVDEFDTTPPPKKLGKGLTEYALLTGKSLLCPTSVHEELERRGEVELIGTASPIWLGVPLHVGERTIGVMVVQHYADPTAYGEREQHMLEYVSSQVAQAIERKRVEEVVRLSEEKFSKVFRSSPDAISISTLDEGRYLEVNEGYLRLSGYTREEVIGHTATELGVWAEPKDRGWLIARLRAQGRIHDQEFRFRPKAGEPRVGSLSAEIIALGGETCLLAVVRDITERKQFEEALRRSETNYRSLVENAPYGIFQASPEGKCLAVNPALIEMLGYGSAAELLGRSFADEVFRDPAERARFLEQHWSQERFEGAEVGWQRRSGKPITVRLGGRQVRDEQGQVAYVEVMAENVTERRVLEQQLRQALKMEAVGRLAGGIAHDFNNLLMVIRGHSELLRTRLGADHPLRRNAEEIDKAAERAAALTQQLLAFSRKQMLQPRVLDLNMVVAEMETMLRRLIGEDIELVTVPGAALGRVKADPGQLEQVVLNLGVNARDAMPEGGKLVIETANAELDEVYASQHPGARPGSYVMLAVSDSGVGMDAETQAHLFEPFFTTKEKGRGTGLGLATVYGIVKQSDGYIWVYSEPGRGTTFKIYLPRVEGEVTATKPARVAAAPRGSETILLVEDEAPLRKLAREFLESNGYRVLEAGTGAEALQLAGGFEGAIHLLMTDVVMPGMSGRELAERLGAKRPETKVLYMSGYTDDAIVRHGVLAPGVIFLQKPFTLEALARKLREVLDATPAS